LNEDRGQGGEGEGEGEDEDGGAGVGSTRVKKESVTSWSVDGESSATSSCLRDSKAMGEPIVLFKIWCVCVYCFSGNILINMI